MRGILTLKPWQLFLLMVLPSFWKSPGYGQQIAISFGGIVFTIWIYAIGVYGQEKIKLLGLPLNKNIKLFKLNIILIPILISVLLVILHFIPNESNSLNFASILFIPVILYLFCAIIQTVVFACKTLSSIELKKEATFNDYFLYIILTGLLVGGIWVLQPKITKLIANKDIETS